MHRTLLPVTLLIVVASTTNVPVAAADAPRKIVLIAGPKSHGPVGNGIHDYPWSVKLLKVMLDNSNVADRVRVEYHLDGWPEDPATLDDADTIMVVSDGRDGDKYEETPHFQTPEHAAAIQKQIDRGCGFVTFHFSTFAPDQYAKQSLEWTGGYFDWEENGERKWYSAIEVHETEVVPATPGHAVLRGVGAFTMKEEFYFNIRFQEEPGVRNQESGGVTPIWRVPVLPGREPDGNVVAWAKQRANGGRGFGTTCGHFYANWEQPHFRRLILNALVWTAGAEVPEGGVEARYYTQEEITAALTGRAGSRLPEPAPSPNPAGGSLPYDGKPIRVLIFAGNEAHKWHNWEKTTPAIKTQLEIDPRITVDVSNDIEDLARKDLAAYDVIVQNSYANWQDPKPLSEAARTAFVNFLQRGGGLVLIHFANGAWNFSLPMAEASDWPEYRKIVRRVWNHKGEGEAKSGHDAFGAFAVKITPVEDPITAGLGEFGVTDELYFRQDGTEPIEPLIEAHSKVTDRDEPLAWKYTYGKGRVFQTLLGHSERTYEAYEACEMLRRAVAWCAGRKVATFDSERAPPQGRQVQGARSAGTPKGVELSEGRFGKALDARTGGVFIAAGQEQRDAPVSVECWTKLRSRQGFNILAASEAKGSPTHWELYSYAGSGAFSVYMPGRGGEFRSDVDICDGQWHHVGMMFESTRLRMFVDGRLVVDRELKWDVKASADGPIAIGRLVEGGIGCDGLIDDLRISRGLRTLESIPAGPLAVDDATIGLWRFDALNNHGGIEDESSSKLPASVAVAAISSDAPAAAGGQGVESKPATAPKPPKPDRNHWGREVVGFDWLEEDSVDGRWQQTTLGRWQACLVALPEGPVRKGLSIRVGDKQEATICYDTEFCTVRAGWTGGFLQFDPARYGLIGTPRPQGTLLFSTGEGAGWQQAAAQYEGLAVHGERVLLQYAVDGVQVRESPWLETRGDAAALVREFEIGPTSKPLRLNLLPGLRDTPQLQPTANRQVVTLADGDGELCIALIGSDGTAVAIDGRGARVDIAPREELRRLKLLYWRGQKTERPAFDALLAATAEPAPLDPLLEPGPARWNDEIVTHGVRARDDAAYVIDTITIPFDNPYHTLFFVGGHDFFSDGRVALCTAHGEVWTVSGVDDDLDRLVWKRYATGLFQALGLKIVDDTVYVLGRDQITKLHDHNGDGEADSYECFSNRHFTSAGGHDYVTCLETDSHGNFYFLHGKQGLLRLSPDGKTLDVVSTGLRNPNGMGIGPGDVITVAPQEGEWTPASYVGVARPGRHFGYLGPQVAPERPLGYDPPLFWIPRAEDNSCGGQVWVTNPDWGPLTGKMLHLSYGQCRPLLVLQEEVDGVPQAGVVTLPLEFDSGIMRGRFSPHDGQLYLSGLRGWTTRAVNDGCLQRMRYTGLPAALPVNVETWRNGLKLTFSQPLDPDSAQDPGNYSIERWNYRYAAAYGSPDLKPSNPNEEGHDPVEVLSATLQPDGRTVFIETPPLAPVHQFAVTCRINTQSVPDAPGVRDTGRIRLRFTHSMRAVPERMVDPSSLVRRTPTGALPDDVRISLQPGLLWRFAQTVDGRELRDARTGRLATLFVAEGEPPTPFLPAGPFTATAEGYASTELSGDFRFAIEGAGEARLEVNGRSVLHAVGDDLARVVSDYVPLHKGYNAIRIDYRSPSAGAARLRLLWLADPRDSGLTGNRPLEPLSPTVLSHRSNDPELITASVLRHGRELFAASRCDKCHQAAKVDAQRVMDAPHLGGVARRLTPEWVAAWLRDPESLRNHTTMPAMLAGLSAEAQVQAAADLTAWLHSSANQGTATKDETSTIVGDAAAGESLWEDLGCIVCHHFRVPSAADEYDRTSLHFVAAKYTPEGLREFLRQPHARNRWSRMPDFHLSPEETSHLAAYIRRSASGRMESAVPDSGGNVDNGRRQFTTLGCGNCHQVTDPAVTAPTRPSVDLFAGDPARGCLDNASRAGVPLYRFTGDDRRALAAFLQSGPESLQRSVPVETVAQFMKQLRCTACHDHDAGRSPRRVIVVEDGQRGIAPDNLPSLTWTGEKLHSDWTQRLLAGQLEERMRPWQPARMPAFPAYAAQISEGLAAQHGLPPEESIDFEPDPQLAELGRQLTVPATLDCRQCHGVGSEKPRGDDRTQIALGINFAHVKERLRHDYYRRFVLDPPRYDINTRMPRLAATDGTTRIRSILGGDAPAQFEAVWHFIQSVPVAQQSAGSSAAQSSPVTP